MKYSPRIRICEKCEDRYYALRKYSKVCHNCKGIDNISIARCPKCNYLQLSTAISRFVCKNCRHSPLPKSVDVVFSSNKMEDIIKELKGIRNNPLENVTNYYNI